MKFTENALKQQESIVWLHVAHFVEFFFLLLIFSPFYWFDQKGLFKEIQIFLRICPFSNFLRKSIFLSISDILSEIVTFLPKK